MTSASRSRVKLWASCVVRTFHPNRKKRADRLEAIDRNQPLLRPDYFLIPVGTLFEAVAAASTGPAVEDIPSGLNDSTAK
jgi:hypothetical protein